MIFPELPVSGDPLFRVFHGVGPQAAAIDAAVLAALQQLSALENAQMLRDRGERYVVGSRQIAYGSLALREAGQNTAAGGIGQGPKSRVQD